VRPGGARHRERLREGQPREAEHREQKGHHNPLEPLEQKGVLVLGWLQQLPHLDAYARMEPLDKEDDRVLHCNCVRRWGVDTAFRLELEQPPLAEGLGRRPDGSLAGYHRPHHEGSKERYTWVNDNDERRGEKGNTLYMAV